MSLEFVAKLNELAPKQGCVYKALEQILQYCEVPNHEEERMRLSVGLSLCEFATAKVDYPLICEDPSQLSQCIQLLESRGTWWTTFNGNYHHIMMICHSYQPQFEIQQILQSYRDAHQLYEKYQQQMTESANEAGTEFFTEWKSAANEASTEFFTEWKSAATSISRDIAQTVDMLQNGIEMHIANSKNGLESVNRLIALAVDQLLNATTQLDSSQALNQELSLKFDQHKQHMDEIYFTHLVASELLNRSASANLATSELLQRSASYAANVLEHSGKALERYHNVLKAVVQGLAVLAYMCRPLAILLSVFFVWWWWWYQRRASPLQITAECDTTFL